MCWMKNQKPGKVRMLDIRSPDATTVSQYLSEQTGFQGSLAPSETLCNPAMHLVILHNIRCNSLNLTCKHVERDIER